MIKATFGLTKEPFFGTDGTLLPQQVEAIEMIRIHAQHGGFSVVVGHPGLGKSVIREHLEQMGKGRDTVVVCNFPHSQRTNPPFCATLRS